MKKNRKKEIIIVDKDSLKKYKRLSFGLENCENFNIDIADVLDISCEAYRYEESARHSKCYHTTGGYILLSSKARDILSDDIRYIDKDKDDIEDYKLYKRMALCDDMCVFSLLDESDKWNHIYVPYDALETVVHRAEIDYANCPSFRILENGDMEIRFGKLSRNPIIPRNNYSDLVKDWKNVPGDFNPKKLKLKVRNRIVEYRKEYGNYVRLDCTVLNKKRQNEKVSFYFNDFDNIVDHVNSKIKNAHMVMSKLCNGNIYFGIEDYFWVSCQSCEVLVGENDEYDDKPIFDSFVTNKT